MLSVLFGIAVFLAVLSVLAVPVSRQVTMWGAVLGPALGVWFIAPFAIAVHYLYPSTFSHWAIISAFITIAFAVLGAIVAGGLSIAIAIYTRGLHREFRSAAWAAAIWAAVGLPYGYLGLSAFVEWWNLHHLTAASAYAAAVRTMVVPHLVLVAALLALYRWPAAARRDVRGARLAAVLIVVWAAGLAALPFRVPPPPVRAGLVEAPLTVNADAGRRPSAPLLVVGLDGGNWRTIRPHLGTARLPTLSRLAAEGVQGNVEALWPPYWSTPAWGAILTGHPGEELGVHEDLAATAPGLPPFELPLSLHPVLTPLFLLEYAIVRLNIIEPMPAPREMLRRTPIWQRLERAGVRTAVVRFPFTYPAEGQASVVVSNRVVTDLWSMLSVSRGDEDELVWPRSESRELLHSFSGDDPSEELEGWPEKGEKPRDALVDPVDVFKRVERDAREMQQTTLSLIKRHPELSVVMLHVSAFDNVCHAFWQYKFPEDFPDAPPDAADVARLGGAIDRALELFDAQLAELIAAFPSRPNVVIVSDHGEGPTSSNAMWRGWHSSPGMVLIAGPDVAPRAAPVDASYYDIVPTMLALQGIDAPADLHGRPLVSIVK